MISTTIYLTRASEDVRDDPAFGENNFDGTKLRIEGSRAKTTMDGINCRFYPEINVQKMTEFDPLSS